MPARLLLAGPAFFVTIIGVVLALAARNIGVGAAAALIVAVLVLGWAADRIAKASLPYHPRRAVGLFWLWSACPGIIAATFIAIIMYLNVTFDPVALGMKELDAEMMKTSVTAIIALLTALFIKLMDNADEMVIGEHVRSAFYAKFKDSQDIDIPAGAYPVILGESPLAAPVFDTNFEDFPAWSGPARWRRAKAIAIGLSDPQEQDRVARFWAGRRSATDKSTTSADDSSKPSGSGSSGSHLR